MDVFAYTAFVAAIIGFVLAARFYVAKGGAEHKLQLAEARLEDMRAQREEWSRIREEMTQAAKASVLNAGAEISSKLLADHKREADAARKDSEGVVQKTTMQLHEQFQVIVQQVAALKTSDAKQDAKVDTMWRALSTPAGAGQLAEIGLENTLKGLGLEPIRDFMLQYTMAGHSDGARLKPDCVIFLPQNRVMVVDCKASKFMMELAEAESPEARTTALTKLKRTMQDHLKALVSRDYRAAIQAECQAAGRADTISHVFSVMYLPTESALASLREADNEFLRKAEKEGIILAGPASLYGLLSLASLQLSEAQKNENREQLVQLSEELLDALVGAFSHMEKVGKGISNAAENFSKFAGSTNRFVLPRMRKLVQQGARPAKARDIPARLAVFEVRALDEAPTLDAEGPETTAQLKRLEIM